MADVSLLVATTLSDWAPDIADAVSDRNAFMAFMKVSDKNNGGKGRKRFVVVDGGTDFRETVFFNTNSTFKGYSDRETIDTTVGNPVKEAQFAHKIVAGSINISLDEEVSNTTKYQIHNLADVKREEAEISMAEVMGASALSDGTTDTKIPGGLQQIISTTNNTVGTIDSSVNTGWRPQRDTSGVTAWNTTSEGLIALDAIYELCTRGPEQPDAIITTTAVKSLINVMMINRLTLNIEMNKDMAKMGFDTVRYRKAEVMADDNVPSQTLYLVNTKFTRFQVMRGANFDLTPMKSPIGGLYKVMQLYVVCNFTCGARRLNGVMTAIAG